MPSHAASPSPGPPRQRPGAPACAFVLDRAQARAIDTLAVQRHAMTPIVLMENAARHVAEIALDMAAQADEPRILLVCGPGNNGGDGLGAARHLHNLGARVGVLLGADEAAVTGDAATNLAIARTMGLPIDTAGTSDVPAAADRAAARLGGVAVIVDALFGTGLTRDVREPEASLVRWINARRAPGTRVLAVDLPSGLDCDTGRPLGVAVKADVTVTLCGLKKGFLELGAQEYVGEVVVADIGVPRELVESLGAAYEHREPGDGQEQDDEPGEAGRKPGDSAR